MPTILIRQPNEVEFQGVKSYVKKFSLDDREMNRQEFKVLLYDNKLAAFGRLKNHTDGIELCTIGVVEEYRGKQLGNAIVRELLSDIKQDVYLVTVIPAFFTKLGFKEAKEYPIFLQNKRDNFCEHHHPGDCISVLKYSNHK